MITKKQIRKILEREFIAGTVYRVDMDRVDVLPSGSVGALRSLPLTGDRDKVKPGDPVKIITVAGERVALVGDIATSAADVQVASALTVDQQNLLSTLAGGSLVGSSATPADTISTVSIYSRDWLAIPDAVYASGTSVTFPKDVTAFLPKGIKLRIRQSGVYKYFYGIGAAYSETTLLTTLTMYGGHNNTIANEAIEEFVLSSAQTPLGFPEWFINVSSWTSTGVQPSAGNATGRSYVKMDGSLITWNQFIRMGSTTTYGTGWWRFSLPVSPVYNDASPVCYFGTGRCYDSSTATHYPLLVQLNNGQTYHSLFLPTSQAVPTASLSNTVPFTWATVDELGWQIQYRF